MKLKSLSLSGVLLLGLTLAPVAFAADQHAGDVQPWLENGQIQLNAELFESDFGDLPGGLYRTDDPGYDADTAKGAFGANNWLWFSGIGSLQFWNGAAWTSTVPNGEHVEVVDAIGNTTVFTTSGVTNPNGVVGQFDSLGDLHEHLDMSVWNASNVLGGTVGAYWITLALFETAPESQIPVSTPSVPFSIIFNRGLSTADYETAVSAVPVPAAVWLFGSSILGLMGLARRKVSG